MKQNKKMGFWTVLALTLTATIGSSVIISFSSVFGSVGSNPLLMIIAWVVGGLIILPETFLMVEPAISFKENGTNYSWLKRSNWKIMAFWFGWVLTLFVSASAIATSSLALSSITAALLKIDNIYFIKFFAIAILAVIGLTQIFIRNSSQVTQFVFLVIKSLPIILILILAVIFGTSDNLLNGKNMTQDLTKIYMSSLMLIPAITLTSFAYSGTEVPTYVAGEIDKPEKTIPKSILIGVAVVIVVYLVYIVAILSIAKNSSELEQSGISGFSAIPNWVKIMFNVLAILLFAGSINSFLLYQSRLVYKMAEEKDLHNVFLKTNKFSSQPYLSMLLLMLVAVFYIVFNQIIELLNYFALTVSLLKVLMITNVINLRKKDESYIKIYKPWVFWTFVVFGYLTCFLTLAGSIINLVSIVKVAGIVEIWKPLVMISIILLIFPVGYLKFYLQNKLANKSKEESENKIEEKKL
ncbi:amino acid permease [Spiroplasma floricola]|uniref:Fructoselysine transporter n=1 Tax=Spiroplasma floricola 23-6 TaxID=1336749 RepID=A0A2K8SCZ6_9MOLU|nr:amino acid permease [Spiroplasma floricola]AUB31185.1 fructoselysine transporter [Spiroplasma floricola 23-6]